MAAILGQTLKNYYGTGVNMHKLIRKLPTPAKTLPGHNYSGPYNPLSKQLKYNPETGEIEETFQQPTGSTNTVAMQHDVDYGSSSFRKEKYSEDEKKCC